MPFSIPRDLPGLYDLGIETRDASSLACLDRNGVARNISQLGLVGAFGHEQNWATELQEKSKLVQLQASIVDREFDQWVQYSQGDWSGGQGVRISPAGQSPNTYWDGQGLIWPVTDWQPQQPFDAGAIATPAASTKNNASGTAGGFIGALGFGYLMGYSGGVGAPHYLLNFVYGTGIAGVSDPYGVANLVAQAFCVGGSSGWSVSNSGVNATLWRHDNAAGNLSAVNIINLVTDVGSAILGSVMTAGYVGNKLYVATWLSYVSNGAGTPGKSSIIVCDMTSASAPALTTLPLPVPSNLVGGTVTQIAFQGGHLICALTDNQTTTIISYSFASAAWTTLMQIPGSRGYFTVVGGNIFVLNVIDQSAGTFSAVDMYSLVGSNLSYLGSLPAYSSTALQPDGYTQVTTWGPYAVFAASYTVGANHVLILFAYDMIRNRLFKAWVSGTQYPNGIGRGIQMGVMGPSVRNQFATTFTGQWGVAVPLGAPSNLASYAEELWFGVTTNGSNQTAFLQGATDMVSSIIDMTSSQNKLWRQAVVTLTQAMQNSANVGITIKVWIDKDLNNLGAPDYTKTVLGNDVTTPAAQVIALPLNRIGRKLVYEVTTIGGTYIGGAFYSAPKIQSVAIQTATGWVIDYKCSFSRSTLTNSMRPDDYVFDRQGVDEVAGANFMRNLWRLKGGYCKVTLPNGDSYNAVLQLLGGQSKKLLPLADSAPAEENRWEQIIAIRIREDV